MNIDYDIIADHYDRFRKGSGPYVPTLAALARSCQAERVLELGAGTGNNTAGFADMYACSLVAVDRSRKMIEKGLAKQTGARWVQADIRSLSLANGAFQFVFGCYVLHHVDDLDSLFVECARVLSHGYAAFVTASHEFIERHPMNRYFPSFAEVDKARFQTVERICQAFAVAGFAEMGEQRIVAEPSPIDKAFVDKVANHAISTYSLLPAEEFDEGLRRLKGDVEKKGRLDEVLKWESLTIWARKDGQ